MDWHKVTIDKDLHNGCLHIVGKARRMPTLTEENLNEILDAIKNGVKDHKGNLCQVHALQLTQVKLPRNAKVFRAFITQLLEIPQFRKLDLGLGSSYGYILTAEQVKALVQLMQENTTMTHLGIRVPDTRESSSKLASLLSSGHGLTEFSCDITDDVYDYQLLSAALRTEGSLDTLKLPFTVHPVFRLPVSNSEIRNGNLSITFEGGKSLNTRSITANRRRAREEASDAQEVPQVAARNVRARFV